MSLTTSPWARTVSRFSEKTVIGSKLRTAEWAGVPQALRDRAFFSAGVENARTLSALREKTLQGLEQARHGGIGMNKARFVADMRNLLGAAPGDSGQLTDLASVKRLSLIWDFQNTDAHAYAAHKAGMDPDLLDTFPAFRLVRIESRRVPREWLTRWGTAGAQVGWQGASRTTMVALKTSPIWAALSRFGRPWPPFDFGSGMGREDVERDEAEALGLLPKGERPADRMNRLSTDAAQMQKDWNAGLQASVKGLSPEARAWLKESFGDQISIEGDTAVWQADAAPRVGKPDTLPASEMMPVEPLPDVDRLQTAVTKAGSREQAHAIIALPAAVRGSLNLNPTSTAAAQTQEAHAFIGSILHRDVAPSASLKVVAQGPYMRGYFDPRTATAHVRIGAVGNTVHEIVHHIEAADPEILAECKAFLQSRARPGEQPQRLNKLIPGSGYRNDELAIEDDWVARGGSLYAGKVYGGSIANAQFTEILTMGVERLYTDPVRFARDDPEYFKFILKVLRP